MTVHVAAWPAHLLLRSSRRGTVEFPILFRRRASLACSPVLLPARCRRFRNLLHGQREYHLCRWLEGALSEALVRVRERTAKYRTCRPWLPKGQTTSQLRLD